MYTELLEMKLRGKGSFTPSSSRIRCIEDPITNTGIEGPITNFVLYKAIGLLPILSFDPYWKKN